MKKNIVARVLSRIISTIKRNLLVFVLMILAIAGLFYFASLEHRLPAQNWNGSVYSNFSSATPTPTFAPSQGWWSNIKPPTPKP